MKCRLRFVTTEPLLKVNMAKGTGVKHFCFQECFQQKSPMKRGFFKELKAEGGFYSNSSKEFDCNKKGNQVSFSIFYFSLQQKHAFL